MESFIIVYLLFSGISLEGTLDMAEEYTLIKEFLKIKNECVRKYKLSEMI